MTTALIVLVLLLALAPVLFIIGAWLLAYPFTGRSRELQRRYKEGRCMHCGYDLRANPQGRCPECGKFV